VNARRITRACATAALGCALALSPACTAWPEKKVATWKTATGAEQYERLLWKEIKAKNWPEVERHLAATFVEVTPAGTFDRAGALEAAKSLAISDYSIGDLEVHPAGDGMVVTYTLLIRAVRDGQPVPHRQRRMTVWQQAKKAGWTAIAHSWTPIPQ